MGKKLVIPFLLASTLLVTGCAAKKDSMAGMDHSKMNSSDSGDIKMNHGQTTKLQSSIGETELNIPPLLKSDKEQGNDIYYTINAQQGESEIFKGYKTKTLGYNGSLLGPVIQLKKGQTVHLNTKNSLDEATTFHWHGLEIPGDADGGPHAMLQPGEQKEVTFKVEQEAATLWFHPHAMGTTAKQVFNGLAGLIYVEDEEENKLPLPKDYGKNDFPLIIQDKSFDANKQFNYAAVENPDGTTGDTLLVNGTLNPRLTVEKEKVLLRLVNGSNTRNYTFMLSNKGEFQQIASDGGLLNKPDSLTKLVLTPGERAEIVVDFGAINDTNGLSLVTEDGTVILPFHIKDGSTKETDAIPSQLNNVSITEEEMNKPVTKNVELFGMGKMVSINGKTFDMNRIDFTQKKGETEVWEIYNKPDMMGGMIHPFHIHGTQFKVISINGEKPPANEQGYKDTIALNPNDKVKLAVKFNQTGTYMFHCHILEHEENGMIGQVKVQ